MNSEQSQPGDSIRRWAPIIAGAIIVGVTVAAYSNTFSSPFVFDDNDAILYNYSFRHLSTLLSPPVDSTVGGRPMLNLSLGLSYAISGMKVWGFHLVNLAIHAAAGLALFGVARRTLERLSARPGGPRSSPLLLGFCIALLWTVHPMQTESVTYIVQRAESLVGMFYLLMLYCFIRGAEFGAGGGAAGSELRNARCVPGCPEGTRRGRPFGTRLRIAFSALRAPSPAAPPPAPNSSRVQVMWFGLSWLSCLFGMGTKEVMVTAPVMVFIYDWVFVAEKCDFVEAWRRRWRYYCCLASTYILLAFLIASTGWNRKGSIGFGIGIPPWLYWLTQFKAIVTYLRLALWPSPLVFDREPYWVTAVIEVAPYALVVVPLALGTVWLFLRRPRLGFLGVWFFGILALTSVVPGTSQMIVEHRVYLSLAAVVAAIALGADRIGGRRAVAALVLIGAPLAVATYLRNNAYRSSIALWKDTVEKHPLNAFARTNLGVALEDDEDLPGAMNEFTEAIRLLPTSVEAQTNMAVLLMKMGKPDEAMPHFAEALKLKPDYAQAHIDFGNALAGLGRVTEGVDQYREALRLEPESLDALNNLGASLAKIGRADEAVADYLEVLRIDPDYASARYNLGNALAQAGRYDEAAAQFRYALRIDPKYAEASMNLANVLMQSGKLPEAVEQFEATLQLKPDFALAHNNLGRALSREGREAAAAAEFEKAIQLQPGFAEAHMHLGVSLAKAGRTDDGIGEFREAIRLRPDYAEAHQDLGVALMQKGMREEAQAEFQEAERLRNR